MNKDKREELYYKQLDLIVRQWMCDIHYSYSNSKDTGVYQRIFTRCKSELREIYRMDVYNSVDHTEEQKEKNPVMVRLSDLELPAKIYKALSDNHIVNVDYVLCAEDSTLLKIPGFGRKYLKELRRILKLKYPNHWSHARNDH